MNIVLTVVSILYVIGVGIIIVELMGNNDDETSGEDD